MDIFFKEGKLKLNIQEDGFTLWEVDRHRWVVDASVLPEIHVTDDYFCGHEGRHYNFKFDPKQNIRDEIEDLKKRINDLEKRI